MSFIATAIIAGTTLYTANKTKKASERAGREARMDSLEDQRQARKASVFAETEGKGTGQLGQISLEVDSEIDEDEELSSNVSI
tara:strand:- start:1060 stop:1308 length:249 start_codon:yes stop_codon:yes gene_type:complete